jgi:hypothetical protein
MVTGLVNHRVTFDFDGNKGVQLAQQWGIRPHRRTGSGGFHWDVKHPGWYVPTLNGKSKEELGRRWPGLDVKGDGGYAIAFGRNASGAYDWLRLPAPDEPGSVSPEVWEFLRRREPQPSEFAAGEGSKQLAGEILQSAGNGRVDAEKLIRMALDRVPSNGRELSGFWLAQQLRDNGYAKGEAYSEMRSYRSRTPDTNTKGQREEYTEAELVASLDHAYERVAREPWERRSATVTSIRPENEAAASGETQQMRERAASAQPAGDSGEQSKGGIRPRDLPDIQTNGRELREASAEVQEALRSANQPAKLFARAALVVRVDRGDDGQPIITTLRSDHMVGAMTRAANFHKLSKSGKGDFIRTSVDPPLKIANDILSLPIEELGFPALEAVCQAPFARPDGSIVSKPGYDAVTRTYLAPVGNMEGFFVPDRPTVDDVDGARGLIEEALAEFPFVDQSSFANAFGLFITPESRQAIEGNVPGHLLDAPQAGSGKTLLAAIVTEKNTGGPAAMKPAPIHDEPEWRKTLTATIQAGHGICIFDNVDNVLNSPNLALALTARVWTDRRLGVTELITFPQRTVFILTGNNLILGGDLARRCVWVRLDAQCSEPWRNRKFKHPDLLGWICENRGRLLGASLTLVRAWVVAGRPRASSPVLGSFEEWCTVIGGILEFAGISGFLGNLDQLYRQSDPWLVAWEGFLVALMDRLPDAGFKCSDVILLIHSDQQLRAAVPEDLGDVEPIASFQRRLGRAFLKRVGKRHGENGIHITRAGEKQGSVVWRVQYTEQKGVE